MGTKQPEWYSFSEVADLLGVTRQRVHQLCDELAIRKRSRSSRFSEVNRKDVNRLLVDRQRKKRV